MVAAALLGAGGALKIRRPATTARALGEMGLPSSTGLVRMGAGVEVAIALGALFGGHRLFAWFAALVAVSYLAFAGFVTAALRRGVPVSSCGCFGGADDTPPSVVHVIVNLAASAVSGAAAFGSSSAGFSQLADVGGSVVLRGVFLVLTAASAWFAYVALTLLPRVLVAGGRSLSTGPGVR